MRSVCINCQQSGDYTTDVKPRWCRCHGIGGPYHAPRGTVVVFTYMTPERKAERDAALAIKNEYIATRDALVDARWTDSGRRRSAKARVLVAATKAFRKASRALEALQAVCAHEERSIYQHSACAHCAAVLDESEAA